LIEVGGNIDGWQCNIWAAPHLSLFIAWAERESRVS
jgi:hypothetical protein